ncbi:MAG: acyl-CoA thioesterase [Flavisolibacter sp.]
MNENSKIWRSKSLIRFSDCDPFNHLNNARYIDYFINAREDQIRENMGFDIYQYAAKKGMGWVVSKNQIVYLKPAFLMETVIIESAILQLDEKSLLVEMKMWNGERMQLKSVLWSQFVHINMQTQKPAPHPEDMMDLFKPLENPLPSAMNFDERIDLLRRQLEVKKEK